MDVRTYRANSMRDAIDMVRRDLGPSAAVLHTRRLGGGMFGWLGGGQSVEVTASASIRVPSRLPDKLQERHVEQPTSAVPAADQQDYRARFRASLRGQPADAYSLVEHYSMPAVRTEHDFSGQLIQMYADLMDAEIGADSARELLERVRQDDPACAAEDLRSLKARVARLIEKQIPVCGPIALTPGKTRLVALVGPTGVGKTTTIAKLAANYRLRERRRVGLITVDTYRIAAVEQLRTYADIIDLPMEVVATPREMREAVQRLSGLDLILMDTAGRSPRDEVKIQELKSLLAESGADEVHLVLSCVASPQRLSKAAERFALAGTTSLILTKLDESLALGNVLQLLRSGMLPLSYVTTGQNVPDDIEAANPRQLAHHILGIQP